MPNRTWTETDNVKLRSLAGRISIEDIAAQLGRSAGATVVQASKLKVSLSRRRLPAKPVGPASDPGPAGFGSSVEGPFDGPI